MNELAQEETGDDFVAGPTQRNDVGNTKRAAAKATGVMGASKKLDPDLDINHVDDNRVTSGSKAGLHSFKEVPEEEATMPASRCRTRRSPRASTPPPPRARLPAAPRPKADRPRHERRRGLPRPRAGAGHRGGRAQGHPGARASTASQSGARSQSSTGDEKPPKRSSQGRRQRERAVILGPIPFVIPDVAGDPGSPEQVKRDQSSAFSGEDLSKLSFAGDPGFRSAAPG